MFAMTCGDVPAATPTVSMLWCLSYPTIAWLGQSHIMPIGTPWQEILEMCELVNTQVVV